jgi:aryl-alcohol dehydrogenase (NADP+)
MGLPAPVTVQNSLSLLCRSADRDVAEALHREGMRLLAFSPLAGGYLTGKYLGGAKPSGARYVAFDNFGIMFRKPMVPEAVAAFAELAQELQMPLVDMAFGYVRSRWYVAATIVGATHRDQLAQDIRAAQLRLDPRVLDAISKVHLCFPNAAP